MNESLKKGTNGWKWLPFIVIYCYIHLYFAIPLQQSGGSRSVQFREDNFKLSSIYPTTISTFNKNTNNNTHFNVVWLCCLYFWLIATSLSWPSVRTSVLFDRKTGQGLQTRLQVSPVVSDAYCSKWILQRPQVNEATGGWSLPRTLLESQLFKWEGVGDTYYDSGTLTLITHWWPPNCHPQQRWSSFLLHQT